jgi:hypothetical protein
MSDGVASTPVAAAMRAHSAVGGCSSATGPSLRAMPIT